MMVLARFCAGAGAVKALGTRAGVASPRRLEVHGIVADLPAET